jgi:hypothetical protein
MSRRWTFHGYTDGPYGPEKDLRRPSEPSDGQIRSYVGVINGLKGRRAIDVETARRYRNILLAKGDKRSPEACRIVIEELDKLLKKSPSPRRHLRRRGFNRWYW